MSLTPVKVSVSWLIIAPWIGTSGAPLMPSSTPETESPCCLRCAMKGSFSPLGRLTTPTQVPLKGPGCSPAIESDASVMHAAAAQNERRRIIGIAPADGRTACSVEPNIMWPLCPDQRRARCQPRASSSQAHSEHKERRLQLRDTLVEGG